MVTSYPDEARLKRMYKQLTDTVRSYLLNPVLQCAQVINDDTHEISVEIRTLNHVAGIFFLPARSEYQVYTVELIRMEPDEAGNPRASEEEPCEYDTHTNLNSAIAECIALALRNHIEHHHAQVTDEQKQGKP